MLLLQVTFLMGVSSVVFANLEATDEELNRYSNCQKTRHDVLNIHLIPHSHDDVGWLKTVEQYYLGTNWEVHWANVTSILSSAVESLLVHEDRRFIYVESAYFSMWWDEQSASLKRQVKNLVAEGRLEFANGAWSMNDEACVHYQSTIDQFSWGLRFLKETFGDHARPTVAWQIDPFGHSREHASLMAQMGYDGIFFPRIDFQDKEHRKKRRTLEMVWEASRNLVNSGIFTAVMFDHYVAPAGFCFDWSCSTIKINDDEQDKFYNVDERSKTFLEICQNQSLSLRTNNVMIPMGEDFSYMSSESWFSNMDKLIKYFKNHLASSANIFYSTPACYLKSLHDANISWPTKSDDFFPYATDTNEYWTGYFTSRPNSKRFERTGNHFLQIVKQLSAATNISEKSFGGALNKLRGIMGVLQHHDAITGTEKQNVAEDYHKNLHAAIVECEKIVKLALKKLFMKIQKHTDEVNLHFKSCLNLNISECETSASSENLQVTVYNPLSQKSDQFVRFPVPFPSNYKIFDGDGYEIPYDLVPVPQSVLKLPFRSKKTAYEMVFQVASVPPLGYKAFFISKSGKTLKKPVGLELNKKNVTIGFENLQVKFDEHGSLAEIISEGKSNKIFQNFVSYRPTNVPPYAGAYIFRPNFKKPPAVFKSPIKIDVVKGDLVQEVHQIFKGYISQVVRVYKNEKFVEFEWLVGPLPDDTWGRDVVTRFMTPIKNEGVFYTDSNGREMMKRTRHDKSFSMFSLAENISGNYYPVTSKIAIEDKDLRLAVLNDRSQGASSLFDGEIELMLHRKHVLDDDKGVGQPLNETAYGRGIIARGKHWIFFGKKSEATERIHQNKFLLPNWLFFDDMGKMDFGYWRRAFHLQVGVVELNIYQTTKSMIKSPLPPNIFLMTYEPWINNTLLIRFEHILEKFEDPELSQPVSFDLSDVFGEDNLFSEVSLAANQLLKDVKRLKFMKEGKSQVEIINERIATEFLRNTQITLKPMEIRTFIMIPQKPSFKIGKFIFVFCSILVFVNSLLYRRRYKSLIRVIENYVREILNKNFHVRMQKKISTL